MKFVIFVMGADTFIVTGEIIHHRLMIYHPGGLFVHGRNDLFSLIKSNMKGKFCQRVANTQYKF